LRIARGAEVVKDVVKRGQGINGLHKVRSRIEVDRNILSSMQTSLADLVGVERTEHVGLV
jgi:hypothetical protein